jgi:hypothetical protein
MAVTLAEEIMLLSLDDESGAAKDRQSAGGPWRAGFCSISSWRGASR